MSVLQKYANLLVDYCLSIQAGQKVYIVSTPLAEPLIKEVYKELLKAGAVVEIKLLLPEENKIFLDHANNHQLTYVSSITQLIYETFDAYLYIRAPYNLREDQNIDRKKSAVKAEANAILNTIFSQRTASGSLKRCICQYPTYAGAQEAGMSLEEYEHFIYTSCKLYDDDPKKSWTNLGKNQQKIVDFLNKADQVTYSNGTTNISFSVKDRVWINSDGKANMPSGEVFTAPIEDSVNGSVYFDYPSIYAGQEVRGITLQVKDGWIEEWDAEIGKSLLDEIFKIEGARRFGEVAIGTNYDIQKATKNILFDEKIGGTIHMAVGQSYLQNGGKNNSVIHWDMIADMKEGGKIYVDDLLIYENGYFLNDLAL
jgi:aminopeptidase